MFLLQYTDHISLSHNFEKILFSFNIKVVPKQISFWYF